MIAFQYRWSTTPTEKIFSASLFKEVIMVLTEKIEAPRSRTATALAKHFQCRTEKRVKDLRGKINGKIS